MINAAVASDAIAIVLLVVVQFDSTFFVGSVVGDSEYLFAVVDDVDYLYSSVAVVLAAFVETDFDTSTASVEIGFGNLFVDVALEPDVDLQNSVAAATEHFGNLSAD